MLRDPVLRALSVWNFYHKKFHKHSILWEKRPFSEVMHEAIEKNLITDYSLNPKGIVERGIYCHQLERLHKYFPKEQIHVATLEDLISGPEETINHVLTFLGLKLQPLEILKRNALSYDKTAHETEVKLLRKFYEHYNKILEDLTGRDYNWGIE